MTTSWIRVRPAEVLPDAVLDGPELMAGHEAAIRGIAAAAGLRLRRL
jgi:hypothetical protein